MTPDSLYQKAQEEADRHKYLESQKAGHDLGPAAIEDWQRRHWTLWLRHRWIEHLLGLACWAEFDPEHFGRLTALFGARRDLLDHVAEMILRGAENLDIIWWAAFERRDLATVLRILTELRLNDIRCSRHCIDFVSSLERGRGSVRA